MLGRRLSAARPVAARTTPAQRQHPSTGRRKAACPDRCGAGSLYGAGCSPRFGDLRKLAATFSVQVGSPSVPDGNLDVQVGNFNVQVGILNAQDDELNTHVGILNVRDANLNTKVGTYDIREGKCSARKNSAAVLAGNKKAPAEGRSFFITC